MSKYLELVEGSFNESHFNKQTSQNPYVAYSIQDDKVIYSIIPESPYKMVDLGLPSGLKWADRNVGASSPEDAGLYFQWGDTVGYTAEQVGVDKVFNWNNYKFGIKTQLTKYNSIDNLKVLESIDDSATVYVGSQYRMPTKNELLELTNNTIQIFIDVDGNEYSQEQAKNGAIEEGKLKGVRFTGLNNNSIFIPAAGECASSTLVNVGDAGYLWSSSVNGRDGFYGSHLSFYHSGGVNNSQNYRYYGCSIRGVQA